MINSNLEIRNPKKNQKSKFQILNIRNFGVVSSPEDESVRWRRNSIFGFRILTFILVAAFFVPRELHASSTTEILGQIPVQHAGRVKPFESFAQELVLYVTGKKTFGGMKPTELVWRWMVEPEKWNSKPILPVSYQPLQKELSLMVVKGRIAPEVVLDHEPFVKEVRRAAQARAKKEKLSTMDQKRVELYERAQTFRQAGEGEVPGWIAHPEDPRVGWLPFRGFATPEAGQELAQIFPQEKISEMTQSLQQLVTAMRAGSEDEIAAANFSDSLASLLKSRDIVLDEKLLKMENSYNRLKPFHWAWMLYALAVFLSLLGNALGIWSNQKENRIFNSISNAGFASCAAAFLVHAYGFFLRCQVAGRPPVTNMYESMIWVSWAVVLFSMILFAVYRTNFIWTTAALVTSVALAIAESYPVALDPSISPLVPVLRSNLWLTVHVLTITMSYGAFLLAWGVGHALVFGFAFAPRNQAMHQRISQYLYRTLQIGVILLASGTVLGGVWANYSWGRFWGWDPKETWALIALLGYLTVLHGRFTGWLGAFGIAIGSVIAFLGVLMAWYGVNFVLAAGLHSYGFGGGGLKYVLTVVAIDLAVIATAAQIYKNKMKSEIRQQNTEDRKQTTEERNQVFTKV